MAIKIFTSGRVRKVDYDSATQHLDLTLDSHAVVSYRPVPQEVVRRLCNAPNPGVYFEERIAEEYPKVAARSTP
jgi:hypothetical protein